MRNLIDFSLPPDDLFLNPARDPGLSLLRPAEFFWRPAERALIEGFAASEHDEMTERMESFLTLNRKHKVFSKVIEFNSVPVVLEEAAFRKSYVLSNGRCVLNGASGVRLQNRFCWENEAGDKVPDDLLVDYFNNCQTQNAKGSIPLHEGAVPDKISYAIECRNTFNYFHFLTESLSQLALLAEGEIHGRVCFHFPNAPEKLRDFAMGFVEALFPELAGQVFFERAPQEYRAVVSSLSFLCLYYQFPPEVTGSVDAYAPSDVMWKGHEASRMSQSILSMNSTNVSLGLLRKRALRAIEGVDFSHLPKRFYVGRDPNHARARVMNGEKALVSMLGHFGFEHVVFEHLTPLEQIGLMANAEMMVSYHGAGFTNMLFAAPETYVIELGTLQTAVYRWQNFWPLANVSGCRYVNFFADYNKKDPLENPQYSDVGIIPVHLTDKAQGQVLAFVVTLLGRIPQLSQAADVLSLVKSLLGVRAWARAEEVLGLHKDLVRGDIGLCLAQADCHKAREQWKSELLALHMAWEVDQGRWQTLVRIVWSARRAEMPDVVAWALSLLRQEFPNRYDTLIGAQPWMRQLA
jgi:hypothetical protein